MYFAHGGTWNKLANDADLATVATSGDYNDLINLPTGGASVTPTSDTAPSSPSDGDLWYRSTDGRTYVYYDDGSTAQWVDASYWHACYWRYYRRRPYLHRHRRDH